MKNEDALKKGSPPQVRGKRIEKIPCSARRRITPAGAGKTTFAELFLREPKDHPRRCGENCCKQLANTSIMGSPPQVRGKQAMMNTFTACVRITPAGAGKTEGRR